MAEFKIGYGEHEYIIVKVLSRERPGNTDFFDANWVNSEVDVAVGGFKGNITGSLFYR